jgi:glycosyltransferase involved in cell wall biosynthesis
MFVGYQGRNILWASPTKYITDAQHDILETPPDFPDVDPAVIVREYTIHRGQIVKIADLHNYAPSECKVAMVAQYGINCGIATYTKYLSDQMRPLVKELRIFAEDAEPVDCQQDSQDNVVRCWKRSGDYIRILSEVEKFDPDVIYVQHEYGSFSHGASWNALIGHLNARWRTVVVLHSVYDHPDKLIFEAPCNEIIVHSLTGRDLLRKRGVDQATINPIPHGCVQPIATNVKFSRIESKHVIFQYGFGFEYKGWETALSIVEKLKDKYEDLIYIGIFNVSKFSEAFNNMYYDKLMEAAREKKLEKHFVLHRGFRSEPILLSYMAQAHVNIFPYWNHHEWRVHGASGAVRLALASGTPTIVGDVPFFSEFRGHIPVCSQVDEYIKIITDIFEDKQMRAEVLEKTQKFISDRTWTKIAQWYLQVRPGKEFTPI